MCLIIWRTMKTRSRTIIYVQRAEKHVNKLVETKGKVLTTRLIHPREFFRGIADFKATPNSDAQAKIGNCVADIWT